MIDCFDNDKAYGEARYNITIYQNNRFTNKDKNVWPFKNT